MQEADSNKLNSSHNGYRHTCQQDDETYCCREILPIGRKRICLCSYAVTLRNCKGTKSNRRTIKNIYKRLYFNYFKDRLVHFNGTVVISYTNSIHKVYLCFIPDTALLRRGDLVVIYRTKDDKGPARYRSVITSVCQIEEIKTNKDFINVEDFLEYTNYYSIFDSEELKQWYQQRNCYVIKMTYNIALTKRVTNGYLVDELKIMPKYWGFFQLTDDQFCSILKKGEIDESVIID